MGLAKFLYIGVMYLGALGDLKGQDQVGNVSRLRMGSKTESGGLGDGDGNLAFCQRKAGEIQGLLPC